jgi:hypothetical protein
MRKMILTLAVVLLAAPALAAVEITLTNLGEGVIEIRYDASDEPALVRAFALDIVATDGNIVDINDYVPGDDTGGYGIFPGAFRDTIDVNPTTGDVDSWVGNPNPYTPVAPAGDTDALGEIPGPAITIEMGSLYATAAPGEMGVLCTITIDENVTKVCVTGNAIRGNVVLEDASEATLDPNPVCIDIPHGEPDCILNTPEYALQYEKWVLLSKPLCWCNDYGTDPYKGNQCYGDGAGDIYRKGQIVYTTDLTMLADSWEAKLGDAHLNACADFAHDTYRKGQVVYVTDLTVLATNWEAKVLPNDCPLTDAANAARL